MSDLITLVTGQRPWQPTPDAEEFARLDEYNIPLAGLLRQGGDAYLYVCAAGEEEDANVWLYTRLENEEAEELATTVGRELLLVMAHHLQNRRVTAALADKWELVMWDHFEAGDEAPGTIVRRFLRRLDARVRRYGDNIGVLERDATIDEDLEQLAIC
jgi:hypothetical protein